MFARGCPVRTRPLVGSHSNVGVHSIFPAAARPASGRAGRVRVHAESRDAGTAVADAPPSVSGVSPYTPGDSEPAGLLDNLWQQNKQQQKYAALSKDTAADVVIIGAGIFGLSLAYQLAKNGKSVVVLEGRVRGAGQSGRTSAHIMQWNDDFYMQIEEKFGKTVTRHVAESHVAAKNWIEAAIKAEGIDCNYQQVPGYLFPDGEDGHVSTLNEELEAIQTAGMTDVKLVNLEGVEGTGSIQEALEFPQCADFHPLKYLNGLADAIVNKYGGRIFEGTMVDKPLGALEDGKVKTSTGYTVTAREAVVYATQSPCHHNLAVHGRQEAYRSYMLGLRIPKGSVKKAHFWDTKEIYHYIRTESAGKHDVLIIGGQDHPCGQPMEEYYDAWARLEAYVRQRFPQCEDVVYRWSGEVFEPIDQLHLFGLDPFDPFNAGSVKRYVLTGDSGQGMTGSAVAAMVVGDQIMGKENPWSDTFSPARLISAIKSPMELVQELGNIGRGYAEVVVPRDVDDVKGVFSKSAVESDITPGTGKVVQEGIRKVAVFKDEAGVVSRTSAICPHLGCIVEWNPNDKTFDCACHGSCFDRKGRFIQGPAQTDLEAV